MNSFNDLELFPPILEAITEMGFETPTEVQSKAIPHILKKEDLIVMSKTGSGKTAVFGISMLQLINPEATEPQGLILSPTRELAVQVDSDLKLMAKHLPHKTTAVYGQHNMNAEILTLKKGVTIVTGTPGRVYDHISHGTLNVKDVHFLVIDEADRMLDMGFIDQVVKIIKYLPKDRVTLLFSATIPTEVRRICREYMRNPATIEIESPTMTVDSIQQAYYRVEKNEKCFQLNRLLLAERPESCIIFCNTRYAVDKVQNFLFKKGYASQALHGDIPQSKRMSAIQQFKKNEFHLLVATDVAARGLHVEGLSLVINYDVPLEKDSYVHRIGRTGRAGNSGHAISLVTSNDIMSIYEIEEHIGVLIPETELPSDAEINANKADVEKWVLEQALKNKPTNTVNEPVKRPIQQRSATTNRSQQPNNNQNKRPNQTLRPNTNVARNNQAGVGQLGQNNNNQVSDKPTSSLPNTTMKADGVTQAVKAGTHLQQTPVTSNTEKVVQSGKADVSPHVVTKKMEHTAPSAKTEQGYGDAKKSSVFQSFLNRILGK